MASPLSNHTHRRHPRRAAMTSLLRWRLAAADRHCLLPGCCPMFPPLNSFTTAGCLLSLPLSPLPLDIPSSLRRRPISRLPHASLPGRICRALAEERRASASGASIGGAASWRRRRIDLRRAVSSTRQQSVDEVLVIKSIYF